MSEISLPIPPLRILVVDDEVNIRVTLTACLEADGHQVTAHGNPQDALAETARRAFDLIFLNVRPGTENGLDFIQPMLAYNPWARIIVITAYASMDTAVEAMKRGATDYLPKPFSPSQVELVTHSVAQRRRLEIKLEELRATLDSDPEAGFVSTSSEMRRMLDLAKQVATSNAPVLICGEMGTGKSRLARAIHDWSARSQAPFAIVSCKTDSPQTWEDNLFGLASEAGGDLPPEKLGRISFCDGGTLVLDEITSLPPSLQPKVQRLLTDRQYERRDDFLARPADVRLLATSSVDVQNAVQQNRFRAELLLALDVVRIDLPPLRDRPGDIPLLAQRYLACFSQQNHRQIAGFTTEASHALIQHTWPGNHRELRNLIERMVILCDSDFIDLKHFPPNFLNGTTRWAPGDLVPLEKIQDLHIRSVLAATGSLKGAASILGVNYSTLWRRLKKPAENPAE